MKLIKIYLFLFIAAIPVVSKAEFTCPPMPTDMTQVNRDVKSEIDASVASMSKIKAGEISVKTEVTARNLFEKFPNVDKILALQTMSATYCEMLQKASTLNEKEKIERWELFQSKVLNFESPNPGHANNHKATSSNIQKKKEDDGGIVDDGATCHGNSAELIACYKKWKADPDNLPFSTTGNPESYIKRSFAKAKTEGKIVMIEFGSNWCPDCLVLNNRLNAQPIKDYFEKNFILVTVSTGECIYELNQDVAGKYGADLSKGIPVAVFFEPDGTFIGNTNNKELEHSRSYNKDQIMFFLKKIVNERRIVFPGNFIQMK